MSLSKLTICDRDGVSGDPSSSSESSSPTILTPSTPVDMRLPPKISPSGAHIPLITWQFRQHAPPARGASSPTRPLPLPNPPPWLPTAGFPTTIHQDLIFHGLLPDPTVGLHEEKIAYINGLSWEYRTVFATPPASEMLGYKAVLIFEGLDTFATVYVNGSRVLDADNMFRTWKVDVTRNLHEDGRLNEVLIVFDSIEKRAQDILNRFRGHKWGCWNGSVERLAVRKAQYHWGWDWGPKVLTVGPWRPAYLDIYRAKITDLYAYSTVPASYDKTIVSVRITKDHVDQVESLETRVKIELDDFSMTRTTTFDYVNFEFDNPKLWYPYLHGSQPLYKITAEIYPAESDGSVDPISQASVYHGIRTVELIQEHFDNGTPGTSFRLKINRIPIFCAGSNWIPASMFLPSVKPSDYEAWMRLVRDSNQSMIRIWGGGIYEDEALYAAADKMGILIWQDFMFACGNYPAHGMFLQSIKREAQDAVRRLRKHPSVVIWAGNNEDYQYAESEGLRWDPKNQFPDAWLRTDFPARYIYEKLLRDIIWLMTPETPYHPGSPYGGSSSGDPTIGDLHQWNIWHGDQKPYQSAVQLSGRFVSEFGMQAYPDIRTIDAFLPQGSKDPDRFVGSRTIDFHNKATGSTRRLGMYMAENIRSNMSDLPAYIHATQVLQAEALVTAVRAWKRNWDVDGQRLCSGALVWQMNDVWPGVSWSIVDRFRRPKIAYWALKREFAEVSIGFERSDSLSSLEVGSEEQCSVRLWLANVGKSSAIFHVTVELFEIDTGHRIQRSVVSPMSLKTNGVTDLPDVTIPEKAWNTVVAVNVIDNKTKSLAKTVIWPEPLRQLRLQKPQHLKVVRDGDKVTVSTDLPIKALVLEIDTDRVHWSDNGFDLMPGDEYRVTAEGLSSDATITTRYLGMDF